MSKGIPGMLPLLKHVDTFARAEDGAVTVDWTVLAAAVVGLGVSTVAAVRTGVVNLGSDINGTLSSASIAELGALDGAAPFSYTRLFASDSLYSSWMSSFSGWPDATLLQMYGIYAAGAQTYLDSGQTVDAAYYTDLSYAMQQVLISRGQDVPDGGAALMDVYNQQI